ncbi:MAG: hypothetical protein AAB962_03855 [Patescibacteria group bacterium]
MANIPGPVKIREIAIANLMSLSDKGFLSCCPTIELTIIMRDTTIAETWVNSPMTRSIPLKKTIPPKILCENLPLIITLLSPWFIKGTPKAIRNIKGAKIEKLKRSGNKLSISAF